MRHHPTSRKWRLSVVLLTALLALSACHEGEIRAAAPVPAVPAPSEPTVSSPTECPDRVTTGPGSGLCGRGETSGCHDVGPGTELPTSSFHRLRQERYDGFVPGPCEEDQ